LHFAFDCDFAVHVGLFYPFFRLEKEKARCADRLALY